MAEEIWGALIVALASIIGIVLTQYWSYRSLKRQVVFQSRTDFFQEMHKKNLTVAIYLASVNRGLDKETNVKKIQKIVDEYPYMLPADFVVRWNKTVTKPSYSDDDMKKLTKNLIQYMVLLLTNYYHETLGMNDEEIDLLMKIQLGEIIDFSSY